MLPLTPVQHEVSRAALGGMDDAIGRSTAIAFAWREGGMSEGTCRRGERGRIQQGSGSRPSARSSKRPGPRHRPGKPVVAPFAFVSVPAGTPLALELRVSWDVAQETGRLRRSQPIH